MTSTVLIIPSVCNSPEINVLSDSAILNSKLISPPPGFEKNHSWALSSPIFNDSTEDNSNIKTSPKNWAQNIKQSVSSHVTQDKLSHSYPLCSKQLFRPYKYERYHHFSNYRHYFYRKSAYAVAIVNVEFLSNIGALKIKEGIYISSKNKNTHTMQEACAIIGLSKSYAEQLFIRTSPIYTILKKCPELQFIAGIEDLSPYRLDILYNTGKTFEDVGENEFVLFNIEPRGEADKDRKQYPCPNICLPGGGMESKDNRNWEKTLFREFEEEVGIQLQSYNIEIIAQHRSVLASKNSMYFWLRIRPK